MAARGGCSAARLVQQNAASHPRYRRKSNRLLRLADKLVRHINTNPKQGQPNSRRSFCGSAARPGGVPRVAQTTLLLGSLRRTDRYGKVIAATAPLVRILASQGGILL